MTATSIHLFTEQDLHVVDEVIKAAYPIAQSRLPILRRYLMLQPDGAFVVKHKDMVVGFAAIMNYGVFAYIGLMTVHPAMQKQGIGGLLLEHIFAWLDERGCSTVLLDATPTGRRLYERYDFIEDDETVVLQRNQAILPLDTLPTDVSSLGEEEFSTLIAFDASCFGAERATVLASYRADDPQRVLVAHDAQGHITGYLIAQPGVLGPYVAGSVEDAERLLRCALTLPFKNAPNIFVSAHHERALHLFARYGFSRQRVLSHMRRGDEVQRGRRTTLYGQATLGLG